MAAGLGDAAAAQEAGPPPGALREGEPLVAAGGADRGPAHARRRRAGRRRRVPDGARRRERAAGLRYCFIEVRAAARRRAPRAPRGPRDARGAGRRHRGRQQRAGAAETGDAPRRHDADKKERAAAAASQQAVCVFMALSRATKEESRKIRRAPVAPGAHHRRGRRRPTVAGVVPTAKTANAHPIHTCPVSTATRLHTSLVLYTHVHRRAIIFRASLR
mmetsp:Transcript_26641/g.69250  ORF Transcript_26641/g.69250 Transcript_26641/m.69250 type:complete len:218 (-) Transcript_26641:22-675(-)